VRGPDVDAAVSAYSRVPEVRAALLDRQRAIAEQGRIIVAGRDIGTVVLPNADLKLFLDASAEERARRRAEQRGVDAGGRYGRAILEELRRRDGLDSTRAVAPLRAADDARVLHTDGNRFEDTVRLVVDSVRNAEPNGAAPLAVPATTAPSVLEVSGAAAPTAPTAIPAVATPAPAAQPLESHVTWWMHAVALIARFVLGAVTRVRVEGDLDAIPPSGPVILAANHASNADPVVIGAYLTPVLGRRMQWLGKRELFSWPLIGWMARNGGVHPVDRSTADLDAFRLARRILDEGHILIAFPEGTRSPDGALQPARDGLAMLALRTGAPIVPIGIVGSDRVWPRGRKIPRLGGHLVLRVGRPFRLDGEAGGRGKAAKGAATRRLMGAIAALLPPRQRGVYASEAPRPAASSAP
jgi:1-acyl-sn-glycerol-3-phosphate acyltransferase